MTDQHRPEVEQEEMTTDPDPRCHECGHHLRLRQITVWTTPCWNCNHSVNVTSGEKEGHELYPGEFTLKEREFAGEHGVVLKNKYSDVLQVRYLGNTCPNCDHLQGNWYIYHDQYQKFTANVAEMIHCGPCDFCSKKYCKKHGNYYDYDRNGECPECLTDTLEQDSSQRESNNPVNPQTDP